MKPETRYRINVIDPFLATLQNCWVETIQQKQKHGSADYYLCLQGLFIYLEIKWYKGSLTPLQEDKMLLCKKKGKGIAICAHPANWHFVRDLLSKLDRGDVFNVENEVQRINGIPIPNGNAETIRRSDRRTDSVRDQAYGGSNQGSSGEDFEGV